MLSWRSVDCSVTAAGGGEAVCGAVTTIGTMSPENAATPAQITPTAESATLIEEINLDTISPPLIDPTGVTYLADLAALVIADSGIDEQPTLFEDTAPSPSTSSRRTRLRA